jgi:hypothetical protein
MAASPFSHSFRVLFSNFPNNALVFDVFGVLRAIWTLRERVKDFGVLEPVPMQSGNLNHLENL